MARKTRLLAAVALMGIVGAGEAKAATAFGISGFVDSFGGILTRGTNLTVAPVFTGAKFGTFDLSPTLSGSVINVPLAGGNHSLRWWNVYLTFQFQGVAKIVASYAPAVPGAGGNGGGAGVPGPIAGAGLPALAMAAMAFLRRRRSPALAA